MDQLEIRVVGHVLHRINVAVEPSQLRLTLLQPQLPHHTTVCPRAVLAIDGVFERNALCAPIELPCEPVIGGGWRYLGVPPKAHLRFEGLDEQGLLF